MKNSNHTIWQQQKVKCPKCGKIVIGKLKLFYPHDIYYAYCTKCDYYITESEWEEVK